MGIFDRFKKKSNSAKEEVSAPRTNSNNTLPFETKYSTNKDGNLQLDFYDNDPGFQKMYDTTRLVINGEPQDINGKRVYSCSVSWYGRDDCQIIIPETNNLESLRAANYQQILAEIDPDMLRNDPNYCNIVMKSLLDQKRVEGYIANGLKDSPEHPCGKYVGGVLKSEKGYTKFFSESVGEASHNSQEMVEKRQKCKELVEAQKQKEVEDKKAQIAKLQEELNNMEK